MSPSKGDSGFTTLRSSRSSSGPAHELRVLVKRRDGQIAADARITLLDGWEESKGEGFGEIKRPLPAGLYTLRVERGGAVQEKIVRHTVASTIEMLEPQRPSVVPTFDTLYSHEYYAYTAHEQSLKDTDWAAPVFSPASARPGRLFIFVRAESEELYDEEDLAESLFLYHPEGTLLTDFGATAALQDRTHGWMALSVAAPAGSYRLHFSGLRPREMIIPVFAGWQTQLFVPFQKRPRPAQASVLLAEPGVGFHPDDRTAQVVDAALRGLQSGFGVLPPPEERDLLLHGKFGNPLLGLIGAHLLLLERQPNWSVMEEVLRNLDKLLPGSADVLALQLAVQLRRKEGAPPVPFTYPPLLRRGLEAVLEASASRPELVVEGSFVERIAPYLLADSPWTMWSVPTMVAGTPLDDPLAAVTQFANAELEQLAKGKLASLPREEVSDLLKSALPGVLARVGEKAERGLQRGIEELSSPVTNRMLNAARTVSESAVIQSASQAVLNGVDAALRAQVEAVSLPATSDVPVWVQNIVEDARRRGEKADLESIARQTRLPIRLLRRLMSPPN